MDKSQEKTAETNEKRNGEWARRRKGASAGAPHRLRITLYARWLANAQRLANPCPPDSWLLAPGSWLLFLSPITFHLFLFAQPSRYHIVKQPPMRLAENPNP
jgi:hypothetical protein